MENHAEQTMLQAVEAVKESAKKAENDYDRGAAEIKRMASRTIQLGNGTAVDRVSDIAQKTRSVNDAYFAALQTLVGMLDAQCRPLLAADPSPAVIRQVRDTVKWLNDESEIKTTFSASVNDRSRGDVAAVNYIPTMENKMIQKFWETTYDMHPRRLESEKEERSAAKAAAARLAERIRKQNEEANAAYEKELALWMKTSGEVKARRDAELKQELEKMRKERREEVERCYRDSVNAAMEEKRTFEEKRETYIETLGMLGFFSFDKKKKLRAGIEAATEIIERVPQKIKDAKERYMEELDGIDAWVESRKPEAQERLRKKYPIKKKKPRKKKTFEDPQKTVDEGSRQAIYEAMDAGVKYTVSELMECIPCLFDMTRIRVLTLIRPMIGTDLDRIEEDGEVYFRVIDT